MPPPFKVELVPHNPRWATRAEAEGRAIAATLGDCLVEVHHIGSTAIPGIHAKPVIDLLPVVTGLAALDARRSAIEALGYDWRGEYGLPDRRYGSKSASGRRLVHMHAYAQGSPEIARHLAFRDYLRAHPDVARAYDREKIRCRALHPEDSHAYGACKSAWIARVEAEALTFYARCGV